MDSTLPGTQTVIGTAVNTINLAQQQDNTHHTVRAKTSRYDFVKVRIWMTSRDSRNGEKTIETVPTPSQSNEYKRSGHYHVLSRYLVARSLTTALVPKAQSIRISLACKKRLVDSGRLDITREEWKQLLEQVVREEEQAATTTPASLTVAGVGNGTSGGREQRGNINMERFKMIQWFHSSRTPLLVLIYGSPLIGLSTVATKLGNHLNFSSVLQAQNAFIIGCTMEESGKLEERKSEEAKQIDPVFDLSSNQIRSIHLQKPLYLIPFSSREDLEVKYTSRCRMVRESLRADVSKMLTEGRSVIIEGSLMDPNMFEEMLTSNTTRTTTSSDITSMMTRQQIQQHRPTLSQLSDAFGESQSPSSPASPVKATASVPPIILSFHVSLPQSKQQLLLHNHFAQSSCSVPPATILRNLTWLDSIVRERHAQWVQRTLVSAHDPTNSAALASPPSSTAASPPTKTTRAEPTFVPPRQISLDPPHDAIATMHSAVLEAMQERAEVQGGMG